jgi:protein-tyrosine phosphatase
MARIRKELNFRELGGYKASGGRLVRRGLLYRSGALYEFTPEEIRLLEGRRIRTVLDLRSEAEAATFPDPALPGADYIRISAMVDEKGEDIDYSPAALFKMAVQQKGRDKVEAVSKLCYEIIPFGNPAYRKMFELMLEGSVPMVIHCTAGKDRTGVAAMLILLALGVDEETIIEDYMQTNTCRRKRLERRFRSAGVLGMLSRNLKTFLTIQEGVLESGIRTSLETIHARYGSLEAFFLSEYGLDGAALDRLRKLYTE